MATLLLFRHAKSAWDSPGLTDFDRPLAPRGQRAAPRVANALTDAGLIPDHVICSTARRARETLALALTQWAADMRIDMTREVYEAHDGDLLDLIGETIDRSQPDVLAVFGHNPTMEDLADLLAGEGSDAHALRRLRVKFPTSAVAVLEGGSGGWSDLKPGGMRLTRFIVPRDLPDGSRRG